MSFNIVPKETFNQDSNITIDASGLVGIFTNTGGVFTYFNDKTTMYNTPITGAQFDFDKINDTYVAVLTNSTDKIWYSKDLQTWSFVDFTQLTGYPPYAFYDVRLSIVNNTAFITGYNMWSSIQNIFRSTDGVNWSSVYTSENAGPRSVAYANGKYVAKNHNTYDIIISNDGITWNTYTSFSPDAYGHIQSVGDKFLLIGTDPTMTNGYWSADGLTWQYMGSGYSGEVKEFDGSYYMYGGYTMAKLVWDPGMQTFLKLFMSISNAGNPYGFRSFVVAGDKVYYGEAGGDIYESPVSFDYMSMNTFKKVLNGSSFISYKTTITKTLQQFIQELS